MEEAKFIPSTKTHFSKPENKAENLPHLVPSPQNNKRKFDVVNNQNSDYFRILALLKDLRPYFIEVLRTPDFRNSQAAHEIRKRMTLLRDSYKQMFVETTSVENCKKLLEQNLEERRKEEKQAEKHQPDQAPERTPKEKPPLKKNYPEVKKPEGPIQGMKFMRDSYKHMFVETTSVEKCNKPLERNPMERQEEEKRIEKNQPDKTPVRKPKEKPPLKKNHSEVKKPGGPIQGTYIVGGSAFGWNFIMYPGSKLVYYGVTKESRRTKT